MLFRLLYNERFQCWWLIAPNSPFLLPVWSLHLLPDFTSGSLYDKFKTAFKAVAATFLAELCEVGANIKTCNSVFFHNFILFLPNVFSLWSIARKTPPEETSWKTIEVMCQSEPLHKSKLVIGCHIFWGFVPAITSCGRNLKFAEVKI